MSQQTIEEKKKAIFRACKHGNVEIVRQFLLSFPSLVFCTGKKGWTPLTQAANYGQKEVIELLLLNKAKINEKGKNGWTALHRASISGHKEAIEALLSAKADINQQDDEGFTAIMWASHYGHKEAIEALLSANADINKKSKKGRTAIIWASFNGRKEAINILLSANANVDDQDKGGMTSLMWASYYGLKEVMELLLSAKADVNMKAHSSGWTALMNACTNNCKKENLEILLSADADVNMKAHNGRTALIEASSNGYKEAIEVLLSANANIDDQDEEGWSALMWALYHQVSRECIELLLSANPSVTQRNKCGDTALSLASSQEILDLLKDHKNPCLKIKNEWAFKKNPLTRPGDMNLEVGEYVFLLDHHGPESDWWTISHPEKGEGVVHKSCFSVIKLVGCWGQNTNRFSRPGDMELRKGEEVIVSEKMDQDWWKVIHVETRKELLIHCSAFEE